MKIIITNSFYFNLSKELQNLILEEYILLFKKKHLEIKNELVIYDMDIISQLTELNEEILLRLLNTFYLKPKENEISRHPSRFERIILKNIVYTINYRMSNEGLTAYSLFQLIKAYKDSTKNSTEIKIKFETN